MSSKWRFLSVPPSTHEEGWWPTPRWALRRLAMYAIAALSGGLLFVICAALLAVFSPRGTPTDPTIPPEMRAPAAPPDTVIEQTSPVVAGAQENVKLIGIMKLLENKDKDPQAIRTFTDQAGLKQKYPLGFALFYSDGRKTLYYGRQSSSGVSVDPVSVKVVSFAQNRMCIEAKFDTPTAQNVHFTNACFVTNGPVIHWLRLEDVAFDVEPLAGSAEGAAWIIGMRQG